MKFCLLPSAVILLLTVSPACSQSLTQELVTEGSSALAAAARQRGNGARGAVLFSEQRTGCANCHASGRNDLSGPDLGRLGDGVTDSYLVEAVLSPSKAIRKGFETHTIVTENGQSISGRILEESATQLVLLEATPDRRVRRIDKSGIEARKLNRVSGMPVKLADHLQNRQQFLDLMRYVMSVVDAGPSAASVTARGGRQVSERFRGLVLFNEYNCAVCHSARLPETNLSPADAPNLKWMSGRVAPGYLEKFIAGPHAVKPHSRMPDVLTSHSAADRKALARSLAQYVVSLSERRHTTRPIDTEAAARGQNLYHEIGCVACHSPRDNTHKRLLPDDSVPLGPLPGKYSTDGLAEFLQNPHTVRPAGRMPAMNLTHWEAIDLANYLLSEPVGSAADNGVKHGDDLIAAGEKQFRALGCVHCHQVDETPVVRDKIPLNDQNATRGCLSGGSGTWPKFALNAADRLALQRVLQDVERNSQPLHANDRIALNLTALRCLKCHTRDDLGGISSTRDRWFHTSNPNLGPQGRIPPTLTAVGGKLKPQWLRQVLVRGRSIRPYLKTRMPQFGTDNVAHLVDLLQDADQQPALPTIQPAIEKKEMRKAGLELAGTSGLNCIVCHTFQLKPAATMPAVDLTDMSERLHADWFRRYMRNPQLLSPNTVMPSFWPGGKAIRSQPLNGDVDQQIAALWEWLRDGRQARAPRGLIREPMELLATSEAVMLRRSYSGIGKRGIGVGYPRQVNLAFDAEHMRLAMIWKGKFLDPAGVWRSQGHGTARPLTRPLTFVNGPDVQPAGTRWQPADDRPATHQFRGYSLDEKRRPKFTYSVAGAKIDDYFVDAVSTQENNKQPVLKRTLSIQTPAGEFVFRVASGRNIERQANAFVVDNALRIRLSSADAATIVDADTGQLLTIPLSVRGRTDVVVEYQW